MSTIWSKKVITCMAGAILYVCNIRFRMSAAQVRGVPHYITKTFAYFQRLRSIFVLRLKFCLF